MENSVRLVRPKSVLIPGVADEVRLNLSEGELLEKKGKDYRLGPPRARCISLVHAQISEIQYFSMAFSS